MKLQRRSYARQLKRGNNTTTEILELLPKAEKKTVETLPPIKQIIREQIDLTAITDRLDRIEVALAAIMDHINRRERLQDMEEEIMTLFKAKLEKGG